MIAEKLDRGGGGIDEEGDRAISKSITCHLIDKVTLAPLLSDGRVPHAITSIQAHLPEVVKPKEDGEKEYRNQDEAIEQRARPSRKPAEQDRRFSCHSTPLEDDFPYR